MRPTKSSKVLNVDNSKVRKRLYFRISMPPASFSLLNLHTQIFGVPPIQSHGAEADWINWVNINCYPFELPENVEYKRDWELCDLIYYVFEVSCHISIVWNTYNICQFVFFPKSTKSLYVSCMVMSFWQIHLLRICIYFFESNKKCSFIEPHKLYFK